MKIDNKKLIDNLLENTGISAVVSDCHLETVGDSTFYIYLFDCVEYLRIVLLKDSECNIRRFFLETRSNIITIENMFSCIGVDFEKSEWNLEGEEKRNGWLTKYLPKHQFVDKIRVVGTALKSFYGNNEFQLNIYD